MPDRNKKFHEFALRSVLFKGRSDWYFCFLKSEKIAHVLVMLGERSGAQGHLAELIVEASRLPRMLTHFVAGEVELSIVLADIFSLLSSIRLATTKGMVSKENGLILVSEYELIAEKMAGGGRLSPFLGNEDFTVPELPDETPLISSYGVAQPVKDNQGHIHKGQDKIDKRHILENARTARILEFVRKHKSVSIKDISAVITDCSEKTIQRELATLIEGGFVRKEGDRRWSHYLPI